MLGRFATSRASVLIQGESGIGLGAQAFANVSNDAWFHVRQGR